MAKDKPVGYGNPPKHTRFKKGQSGNPRGRPRKGYRVEEAGFAALIASGLNQTVRVKQGGEIFEMTQAEVLAQRLLKAAGEGDMKAIDKVIKLLSITEERTTQRAIAEARAKYSHNLYRDTLFNFDI
ncbi:MAG: DUF5681 domain-containing protein [Alphaproteobacteria bacterium]|jgi:hypothetical protein|nr:DUF5681 domain-containing protein [Alphaproteobacteria bacterium]